MVSKKIFLHSIVIENETKEMEVPIDKVSDSINPNNKREDDGCNYLDLEDNGYDGEEFFVPLIKLAFARSGDKGDHANIGVISRKPHYLPFIKKSLKKETISSLFKHVLRGEVLFYDVPGIDAINILLKNSLGGGGMASFNIDSQGKTYAQQLLEYPIKISKNLKEELSSG